MTKRRQYLLAAVLVTAAIAGVLAVYVGWPPPARAAIVASVCLILWLTETVPLWLPTVLLWLITPLVFAGLGEAFYPWAVVGWSADPVLVLFFGGFTLAVAAGRWGVDAWLVERALRLADGRAFRFVVLMTGVTAMLSMWMSNIAAATLVFGALRPVFARRDLPDTLRHALLLSVAFGANVSGIATPIGSGPNAIAIAAAKPAHVITFLAWMAFGVPLVLGLLIAILGYVRLRFGALAPVTWTLGERRALARQAKTLLWILGVTIGGWLTEPLHHVPAWGVALGASVLILLTRVIMPRDLLRVDWNTLFLIAGGIGLGGLLAHADVLDWLLSHYTVQGTAGFAALFGLCVLSAGLSAFMSNTGTVAALVPLAIAIAPAPSTAVLIAVSASLGMPFVVSTPPNAMAVANGLPSREMLLPGLVLLLAGCALVALTGPGILHGMGLP